MKYITFICENAVHIGAYLNENEIVSINKIGLTGKYDDMNSFIENAGGDVISEIKDILSNKRFDGLELFSLDNIKLLSPIPNPRKDTMCLGLNYVEHVEETKKVMDNKTVLPKYPVYFTKRAYKMMGPDDIIANDATNELDYEVELAVIIGKEGRDIPVDQVERYIFGYTILNDYSARELQKNHVQWFKGKSLDSLTAIGPCILDSSDLTLPLNLRLSSRINGELRQNGSTGSLLFDIAAIISDLSRGLTLVPGDIIATGTPSGVGMGFNPPKYLKPGDLVECEIERIGVLRNVIG